MSSFPFQPQIEMVLNRLQHPEYLYLVLEPLPLYGLFFAFLFLAVGLLFKQPTTRTVSLILLFFISLSVLPYQSQREKAHSTVLATRDLQISKIRQVTQLRAKWQPAYLVFAAVTFIALLSGGRLHLAMGYLVLLFALLLLPLSIWIHLKEAEAFHPNLLYLNEKAVR